MMWEELGENIVALKKAAHEAGIPIIYVNDNFGKWKSDFHNVIEYVIEENKPGRDISNLFFFWFYCLAFRQTISGIIVDD